MDNPRPPRISRYDAIRAILALDVPVIEQYVYTHSNVAEAAGMVRSLWFSALGSGDVALLDSTGRLGPAQRPVAGQRAKA